MKQLISMSRYIHPRKMVVQLKISDQKKLFEKNLVTYVIHHNFFSNH